MDLEELDYPNVRDHPIPAPGLWPQAYLGTDVHCIVLFPDGRYVVCDKGKTNPVCKSEYDGVRVFLNGLVTKWYRKGGTL